jgi:hypothetical protein
MQLDQGNRVLGFDTIEHQAMHGTFRGPGDAAGISKSGEQQRADGKDTFTIHSWLGVRQISGNRPPASSSADWQSIAKIWIADFPPNS